MSDNDLPKRDRRITSQNMVVHVVMSTDSLDLTANAQRHLESNPTHEVALRLDMRMGVSVARRFAFYCMTCRRESAPVTPSDGSRYRPGGL